MRLSAEKVTLLKSTLHTLASDAKLYLFGSRTDDTRRGGDIDLLVVSPTLTRRDLRTFRLKFFEAFGEQKLDIIHDRGDDRDPFVRMILPEAVEL